MEKLGQIEVTAGNALDSIWHLGGTLKVKFPFL